jgi:chemotaxis family two-component system response regulator Rcp1
MPKKENDTSIDIFVGRKIRDRRTRLGWTLHDVSKKLDVSYQQVQKYEQGASRVSSVLIHTLSNIFCVNANYFFEGCTKLGENYTPPETIAPRQVPLSILLIEPESADELWTRRAFEACRHATNLFVLRDGRSALDFLRSQDFSVFTKPDLIMMEIKLPQEEGLRILRDFRQERTSHDIPVIVLTNSIARADMEEAYKHHATSFISKSMDFSVYKKRIITLVEYWASVAVLP